MRKRLLLLALLLVLAIPLTLVLRDFVQEVIVVPLLYIVWLGRLLFQSIPQPLFWALFLVLALLVGVQSIARPESTFQRIQKAQAEPPGPVGIWARRLHLMARGGYSRWRIAHYLRSLILDVLAYRERLTSGHARRCLETGTLDAPVEVRSYLQAGPAPVPMSPVSLLAWLKRRPRSRGPTSAPDPDLEAVIRYLEDQLEVRQKHGDRSSIRTG